MKKLLLALLLISTPSLWADLVGHYTFNDSEVDGIILKDISPSQNNATIQANVLTGKTGVYAQAFEFTGGAGTAGLNAVVVPGTVVPSGKTERTFSLWFNLLSNAATGANSQNKIMGYGTAAAGKAFDVGFEAGGIRIRHYGGNITYGSGYDFVTTHSGFHHLAIRINPGATTFADVDVILDGVILPVTAMANQGTNQSIDTSNTNLWIGSGFDGGYPCMALVDQFRIFDTAVSDETITALMGELRAWEPQPADKTNLTQSTVNLQWNMGIDPQTLQSSSAITAHYVYFAPADDNGDPNFIDATPYVVDDDFADPIVLTETITGLQNNTLYYWRVDEGIDGSGPGDPNTVAGSNWSFTMILDPIVDIPPINQTVPDGTVVSFSLSGQNIEGWQWYHSTDENLSPATDNTLGTNEIQEVTASVANEGWYYCVVSNNGGVTVQSEPARLMVARQVGWWKLDGNLTDSIGDLIAGAPAHNGISTDPNFVIDGINGGAAEFLGDADSLITIENGASYFNFYPLGFTISTWVKAPPVSNGLWSGLISKQTFDQSSGFVLTHNNNGVAVHSLRQSYGNISSGVEIDDEQWHLVTASYNTTDKTGKVYIDGILQNQGAGSIDVQSNDADLMFGVSSFDNTNMVPGNTMYTGLLDDIRIWNYPLSDADVAGLYVEFITDQIICVESLRSSFDVTGPAGQPDCLVDLFDMAQFVQSWLDCGLIPASACE